MVSERTQALVVTLLSICHTLFNVTAYACVLSNSFSLLEDIKVDKT